MILLLIVFTSAFSAESGYQVGKGIAYNFLKSSQKPIDPSVVPSAKESVDEECFNNQTLSESSSMVKDPAYFWLREAKGTRSYFKIDGEKDLLLNPKESEDGKDGGTVQDDLQTETDSLKVCTEAGDEYIQKCAKILEIKVKVTPEKKEAYPYCPGHTDKKYFKTARGCVWQNTYYHPDGRWMASPCHWFLCTTVLCGTKDKIIPKKIEIVSEQWLDGCTHLEKMAEAGLCRYVEKKESLKNETRIIEGESFKRDHFEEHFIYACMKDVSSQDCEILRGRGCIQTNSKCLEKIDGVCVLYEQTFQCSGRMVKKRVPPGKKGKNVFCEAGDCFEVSYEDNNEFYSAMGHLAILKEAQKDMVGQELFKGTSRGCNRNCIDFRDCCGNGRGWGIAIGLSHCDAESKELMELRKAKRCVFVGTFCAERLLGICIRKKSTFCCFSSKMARVLQEQGRAQLGMGFGEAKCPDCRALTFEEFSRLDFSKINLGELFSDLMASMKLKTQKDLPQKTMEGLKDNMINLQKNTTSKGL